MDHSRRAGRSRSKGVVFSAAPQGPPKHHRPKVATACLVVVFLAVPSRHRTSKAPSNLPQEVYSATPSRTRTRLSRSKSLLVEVYLARRTKLSNKTHSSPQRVQVFSAARSPQANRQALQCSEEPPPRVVYSATAQHSNLLLLLSHCSVAKASRNSSSNNNNNSHSPAKHRF